MKTIKATITSKNQLTLPAKLVRKYGFDKQRIVNLTERNGKIEIQALPSLEERMRKHWQKLPPHKGTKTDQELKQAIRDAFAEKQL